MVNWAVIFTMLFIRSVYHCVAVCLSESGLAGRLHRYQQNLEWWTYFFIHSVQCHIWSGAKLYTWYEIVYTIGISSYYCQFALVEAFEQLIYWLYIHGIMFFLISTVFALAWRNGGRFMHFWWANIIVSLVTECVCYLMPSLDSFWHAQGIISLFGRRFPLYIVLVCK